MVDADNNVIHHVSEDQGEGIKDFMNEDDLHESFQRMNIENEIQKNHEKGKDDSEMLQCVLDKVEALDRKIDQIFGGYVLIRGQWCLPPSAFFGKNTP